ncbi:MULTISPECIES: condensation domain-containing protein [unclassified Streptomyces]|uniref:condensation domain-containing protein n=1 Tax=unclassified Streptomyces TaxID=2593676 RepID=UPI0036EB6F63
MSDNEEGPPLHWAQKFYWTAYRSAEPGASWRDNVRVIVPLPDGTSAEDFAETLRRLVDGLDVLRTSYRLNARGDVAHVLHPPFTLTPEVCDASGAADRTAKVRDFVLDLARREFVLEEAPPVRVGVIVAHGAPRMVAFVLHHIAIDTFGVAAFLKTMTAVLDDVRQGRPSTFHSVRQPSAEARFEASRAAQRQATRAAAYWQGVLDDFPATTVPIRLGEAVGHRPRYATLTSAAGPVVAVVAKRCRAPESAVVLALFAAALGRLTGNTRTAISFSSANRFQPDQLAHIGCLAQSVPLVLEPHVDGTVSALVSQAKDALSPVYRYGQFDYDSAHGALHRRQFAHGVSMEGMVSYNYVDRTSGADELSAWTTEEFRRDGADGTVTYSDPFPALPDHLGLLPRRTGGRLTLTLWHNADLFAEPLVEEFLRGLDRLLASARPDALVQDLVDRADLPAPAREGRWAERDGCRVCLDDVERLVADHPAVRSCEVVQDHTGLTAHVAVHTEDPAGPETDPFTLRLFATARLRRRPAAVVPDRFVITNDGAIVSEGDGYRGPPFAADTPASAALESALRRTSPEAHWSGAASYLTAGGEPGRMDAFLSALEEDGFTGVTYRDLLGLCPPAELVGKLRPVVVR